jgi:hypothetical protein
MAKKRLHRLGYAVWTPSSLKLQSADWIRLESALGRTLDDSQRAAVLTATCHYLETEGMEHSAPFVRDEAGWLQKLRVEAAELRDLIGSAPARDRAARHGLAEVQVTLDNLAQRVGAPPCDLSTLAVWLGAAVESVERRRTKEAEDGG